MRSPSSSSSKKASSVNGEGCSSAKQAVVTPYCSNVGLKRGPWTAEEDELLAEYIKREGEGRWRTLPKKAGLLRCGKSCRLRWMNYLRPSVRRGHITPDEEDLILRLHRLLGNRWSLIAGRIPGRTDNEIKNYWNTHLCKKLIRQGLDPKTHKPFNPNELSVTVTRDSSSEALEHNSSVSNPVPNKVAPFNPNENVIANNDPLEDGQNMDYPISNDEELRNCHGKMSIREDKDIDDDLLNCCIDDSFLNSLINDDMFNEAYQELEQHHLLSSSSCLNILRTD